MCQHLDVAQLSRAYRGASPHQRVEQRRARLVDAGVDVFGTIGYRAATIGHICTRAGFAGALRGTLEYERGGVVVLTAPAAVRDALAGHGGMAGRVPSLGVMRSVKDQFDPGHRLAPGRFPEVV